MYDHDWEEKDNFRHYNFPIFINLVSRFLSVDMIPKRSDHIDNRIRVNSFILSFFISNCVYN